jgi:hypothetical protein
MPASLPGGTSYDHRVELKYARCQKAAIWNLAKEVVMGMTVTARFARGAGMAGGCCVGPYPLIAFALPRVTPAVTQASPAKRYVLTHGRCKAHYVKRREDVKPREHGQTRTITKTFCIYLTTTAKPKTTTETPTTPPSTRTVALHFHLDPSFVQPPSTDSAVGYHPLFRLSVSSRPSIAVRRSRITASFQEAIDPNSTALKLVANKEAKT